ncbi:MAG: hypothetical protein GY859_13585, partial [Desulfobacterales bacterium]|nr:hypothetical protein [Desulfobacterales bacterium]
GRLTAMADPSGTTAFTYDQRGRLIGKDVRIGPDLFSLTRAYTPGGRVLSDIFPTGRALNFTRDVNGKVESISTTAYGGSEVKTLLEEMRYQASGVLAGMRTGYNGVVEILAEECPCIESVNPGEALERTYMYDANRKLTGIESPNLSRYARTYIYDALNRLRQASGDFGELLYTYDAAGNRATRVLNGAAQTYTYAPGSNRLVEISGFNPVTFSHDANGNITAINEKTLVYNQNNQLSQVKAGSNVLAQYTYNGLGQRVKKDAAGRRTLYIYDFDGNLAAEARANGNVTSEYLYNGRSRIARINALTG